MLSIFAVPKPFIGHTGTIQRNALESWSLLRPKCQILLCGNEAGSDAASARYETERAPEVAVNEFGTPLLSSVFAEADQRATHPLMCYVNADIILLPDFMTAVARISAAMRRFMMVGQRWDLNLWEPLSSLGSDWPTALRRLIDSDGTLHSHRGIDYFVYLRGSIGHLPAFAVGRPGWDNWMIYNARARHVPVVDVTPSVRVVHQNHGYEHVTERRGPWWDGPEGDRNIALMDLRGRRMFTVLDATHRLTRHGLTTTWRWGNLRRRFDSAILARQGAAPIYLGSRRIVGRLLRRLRLKH
jgi:hypothetical protein